jgi:hypothetical protein
MSRLERLKVAQKFAPRRNDIAHGVVDYFNVTVETDLRQPGGGFAMFPSYANFKDRSIENRPDYCYTSIELEYFREQFDQLQAAPTNLAADIIHAASAARIAR